MRSANRHSARALLRRCVALALVAALPAAFCAWIDPAHVLGAPADERAVAEALLAGHNATDIRGYDDRAIIKRLIAGRRGNPDVLAIGSSRIQVLRTSAFPGRTFENAGVTAARLEDMLGLYELYDTPARRPRHILLNLDAESLNADPTDVNWISVAHERSTMLARLGAADPGALDLWRRRWYRLRRLIAAEYFRYTVVTLLSPPADAHFTIIDSLSPTEWTRVPDGAMVWPDHSPERRDSLAQRYIADFAAARNDRLNVDVSKRDARQRILEQFIGYLHHEGIAVTLLLVPFHPAVYDAVANPWLTATEHRYREMARRLGTPIIGSYDPRAVGVTADDMFDDSHIKSDALARLAMKAWL
jgi:hypothetical protein